MAADEAPDWLARLYEEHGATLHRLAVLLGVEDQATRIVRSAFLALRRRSHRLIDPVERVFFLQEHVVHLARALRPAVEPLQMQAVEDPRQEELLTSLAFMQPRSAELLVVSHYLAVFGPDLANVMRMSVRGCNLKLEAALEELRARVDAPTPGSQPGAIESLSQELTAALRSAARLTPAPDPGMFADELELIADDGGMRFGVRSVVALTVAAVILGLVLAALTRPQIGLSAEPSPEPENTPTVIESRAIPAVVRNSPLYYVGRDEKLYRELRDLQSTGNLVRSSLEALLSVVPLDPDYRTVWGPGQLLSAEIDGDKLVVDLSAEAYATLNSPVAAERARDQVVYTATELVGNPDLRVFFRMDGGRPPEGFDSSEGYQRRGLEPMPAVWISSPRNQAQLQVGTNSIIGTVKPGLGEPVVRITDLETGAIILEATAQTTAGENVEGWRVWTVTTTLPKGNLDITATILEGDPPKPVRENKTVTVS
ncbi:MAG: GerMN domain-containing protein [Propionibacteriaceae bacterium]|nr:GerMN domain-containing protein [Propionibacteriaceae bacterium]